jgi:hypothetical protein
MIVSFRELQEKFTPVGGKLLSPSQIRTILSNAGIPYQTGKNRQPFTTMEAINHFGFALPVTGRAMPPENETGGFEP